MRRELWGLLVDNDEAFIAGKEKQKTNILKLWNKLVDRAHTTVDEKVEERHVVRTSSEDECCPACRNKSSSPMLMIHASLLPDASPTCSFCRMVLKNTRGFLLDMLA